MRRCLFGSFLALSLSAFAYCAPPDTLPPPIEFPFVPAKIDPPTPPVPLTQPKLTPGITYPIVCRVPCVVRSYPAGLVMIQAIPVPAGETFHAQRQFIDGTADRTWKGPLTVYFVTNDPKANKDGVIDLVVTPFGFKTENEIQTSSVYVDNQKKPKPPPDPIDPPKPVEKSFRVFFVYETADNMTNAQKGVVYGKQVNDYLDANTTKEGSSVGWRRTDKDADRSKDAPGIASLWSAVKPQITTLPCLVVEVNGRADIIPIPATQADCIKLFDKYRGKS